VPPLFAATLKAWVSRAGQIGSWRAPRLACRAQSGTRKSSLPWLGSGINGSDVSAAALINLQRKAAKLPNLSCKDGHRQRWPSGAVHRRLASARMAETRVLSQNASNLAWEAR